MKTILVTGATGLLGSNVVRNLLDSGFPVISAIRSNSQATYCPKTKEKVVLNEEVLKGNIPNVDVVVNCAFARSNNTEKLAEALDFTTKLINGLKKVDVENVINISSQGVYKRLPIGELSREDSPIEPVDIYSMAKYATEKMFLLSGIKNVTNVRLSSLNMRQRFLYHFVRSAKEEGVIRLDSPRIYASIMDVQDAAAALTALVSISPVKWRNVYNMGIGIQYSLIDYAQKVKSVGEKLGYKIDIVTDDIGKESTAGMGITSLRKDTGWNPKVTAEEMIMRYFLE